MRLSFLNPLFVSISLFLLVYAVGLMPFTNSLAAGFSLGILSVIVYPHLRGIKKGDIVTLASANIQTNIPQVFQLVLGQLFSTTATAAKDGKKGEIIEVIMEDGSDQKAMIINYVGFFSPAEVKILKPPQVVSPHADIKVY